MSSRGSSTALILLALCACSTDAPGARGSPSASPPPSPSSAPLPPELVAAVFGPEPSPTAPIPLSPKRAEALAQDLAARASAARESPEAPTRMVPVAGTFELVAGDASAPLDAAVALTQRLIDALYAGPLSHRPDKAVTVWLYGTPAAYARGLPLHTRWTHEPPGLGVYDPQTRAILARTDLAGFTYLHELTHPLLEADFAHAPAWLAEGIPALFEVPEFTDSGVHGKAHFRLQTLRDALASRDPAVSGSVRLDTLFTLQTPVAFYEPATLALHYACAREAARWLDSLGKLWPFYHAFRDGVLGDPTGVASFTRVVGKSPADATADWIAWIGSRAAAGGAP